MAWAQPSKVGDRDASIVLAKQVLRRFSYGQGLDHTDLYTVEFGDALVKFKTNVRALVQTGRRAGPLTDIDTELDWAAKKQLGILLDDRPTAPATAPPVVICAQGTGVNMWTGPPADIGRGLEARKVAQMQPLGDWPAEPFPMWPSILKGIASAEVQIERWVGQNNRDIYLVGYSQGAVVMSQAWKYSPVIDKYRHRIKKAAMIGNPMREQGVAVWDGVGKIARPSSAGIMVDRLTDTPSWWREYAHAGDIYADCELDDEGEFKRAICKIVMGNEWWTGQDNIIEQIAELFGRPLLEVYAMGKAIVDAGLFFGTGTREHINYRVVPAIEYLAA